MTCNECIHKEACSGFTPSDLDKDVFDYCRKGRTDKIPDMEKRCNSFKNKADYAEVKHGNWVEWYPPKEYIMTGEEMLYCCSNCDAKYTDVEGYRHCPYCGTKMDG